jgi:hypothetical protein
MAVDTCTLGSFIKSSSLLYNLQQVKAAKVKENKKKKKKKKKS